jgi:hypothetical protein
MTVHLIKLCVGIDDVQHLIDVQKQRVSQKQASGQKPELVHVTRSFPRRADAVLDGGSMYWVIRGVIRVRQPIVDLRETTNAHGKPACAIVLNPSLVETEARAFRPFQGWRYLAADDAPKDLSDTDRDIADLPAEMAADLRDLGLI